MTLADALREADRRFADGCPEVEISSASRETRLRLLDRLAPVGADALWWDPNLEHWRPCRPDGAWFSAADVLADDWRIS
jgi:hypothetical protein